MARIALNCSCGWNFFIPGSTPGHEVNCPSCAQTVRIPGRKPGKDGAPMSAGDIALQLQRKQQTIRMIVGIAVVGVIVLIVALVFGLGSTNPDDVAQDQNIRDKRDSLPGMSGGNAAGGPRNNTPRNNDTILAPPPPPPGPTALYNSAQIEELRRGVYKHIWMANMGTLISECLRYRNLTNDWGQLQADIAIWEGKIKYNIGELGKVGEKVPVEAYLSPGDQILGFAQRDFTTMKAGEAAALIASWVSNWRAGPTLEQVNIVRGDKKMTVYVEFPEETKELLQLVRHPGLGLEGNPGGVVTEVVAVPAQLIADIEAGFNALPAGYRGYLVPTDRKRLEDLLKIKKGSSDDVDWMKAKVLGEAIPSFQREADMIRSKVLELEPKLKDPVATDVIHRKNGTKFEGKIIQETETGVKIQGQFGAVTISKEDIQKIEKNKGAAVEFPNLWAEANKISDRDKKLEKLAGLLAWCIEKNLKAHKEYVAYVILTLEASNERARNAVGLARPAIQSGILNTTPKYPMSAGTPRIGETVEQTVELIAGDVVSRNPVFTDVVTEMRRRTETLTTAISPFAPEKSAKGVAIIGNPLTFRAGDLTVPSAMEIGSWWSALSLEDRKAFAKYYGLWCAYTRWSKK